MEGKLEQTSMSNVGMFTQYFSIGMHPLSVHHGMFEVTIKFLSDDK